MSLKKIILSALATALIAPPSFAAENYYRPTAGAAVKKYAAQYPKVKLFTIEEVAGGWSKAQNAHFADGGVFDQIYQPGKK